MMLLVGERECGPRSERLDALVTGDMWDRLEWCRESLGRGAFLAERPRQKLASIGVRDFASLNLLPPDPRSGFWHAGWAKEVARDGLAALLRGELRSCVRQVAFVGARVAAAVGMAGFPLLTPWSGRDFECVVLPHPSGRCRWWNDADLASARAVVEEMLK